VVGTADSWLPLGPPAARCALSRYFSSITLVTWPETACQRPLRFTNASVQR